MCTGAVAVRCRRSYNEKGALLLRPRVPIVPTNDWVGALKSVSCASRHRTEKGCRDSPFDRW